MGHVKIDFHEYPKTVAPDDFWGQVGRTVRGKPVSEEQIQMIVNAIKTGLNLQKSDYVLDIACGNGALSRLLFDSCSGLLGYDFSEYLISVAKSNFARPPAFDFAVGSAAEFVRAEAAPERFTKTLCYGSFAYFSYQDAEETLRQLARRFTGVTTVYIGNLPDRELAHRFYQDGRDYEKELSDNTAQIGIWRTRVEFEELARKTGWKARFHVMPAEFYSSHYRYDAILERPD